MPALGKHLQRDVLGQFDAHGAVPPANNIVLVIPEALERFIAKLNHGLRPGDKAHNYSDGVRLNERAWFGTGYV